MDIDLHDFIMNAINAQQEQVDAQQAQITDIAQSQSELIEAISANQAEQLLAQRGIQDVMASAIFVTGVLVGAVLVLVFSHGMRNAT